MPYFITGMNVVDPFAPKNDAQAERSHLAQLCRGFLILSQQDLEKALNFLLTFLKVVAKREEEN